MFTIVELSLSSFVLVVLGGKVSFETEKKVGKISRMISKSVLKITQCSFSNRIQSTEIVDYSRKKIIVAEITLCAKYNLFELFVQRG